MSRRRASSRSLQPILNARASYASERKRNLRNWRGQRARRRIGGNVWQTDLREEVVRSTSKDWFDVRAPGWLATGPCFAPCLLVGIALGSAKISKSNFFAMAVGVTVVSTSAHRPCDHKATRCPASQGQRSPFDEHRKKLKLERKYSIFNLHSGTRLVRCALHISEPNPASLVGPRRRPPLNCRLPRPMFARCPRSSTLAV